MWYERASGVTGTFQNEVIDLTSCQGPQGVLGTFVETLPLELHDLESSSEHAVKIRLHYPTRTFSSCLLLKAILLKPGTCSSEDWQQRTRRNRRLQGKQEELPGTNSFDSWEILQLRSCFSNLEWSATLNLFSNVSRYFGGKKNGDALNLGVKPADFLA